MAEINLQSNSRPGVRRAKRLSTRVDLTPMVDLGFLLITFFIFTTTMAEARATRLIMPTDEVTKVPPTYSEEKTLTFILAGKERLYFYEGIFNGTAHQVSYQHELRNIIVQKKQAMQAAGHKESELLVLIKPTVESTFKNTIDVLDEMLICDVKRYMIVDVSAEELTKLQLR